MSLYSFISMESIITRCKCYGSLISLLLISLLTHCSLCIVAFITRCIKCYILPGISDGPFTVYLLPSVKAFISKIKKSLYLVGIAMFHKYQAAEMLNIIFPGYFGIALGFKCDRVGAMNFTRSKLHHQCNQGG